MAVSITRVAFVPKGQQPYKINGTIDFWDSPINTAYIIIEPCIYLNMKNMLRLLFHKKVVWNKLGKWLIDHFDNTRIRSPQIQLKRDRSVSDNYFYQDCTILYLKLGSYPSKSKQCEDTSVSGEMHGMFELTHIYI